MTSATIVLLVVSGLNALSGILAWVVQFYWGKEARAAKDATIESLKEQIQLLKEAREAQHNVLRERISLLESMQAPTLYEWAISTKQSLEAVVKSVQDAAAETTRDLRDDLRAAAARADDAVQRAKELESQLANAQRASPHQLEQNVKGLIAASSSLASSIGDIQEKSARSVENAATVATDAINREFWLRLHRQQVQMVVGRLVAWCRPRNWEGAFRHIRLSTGTEVWVFPIFTEGRSGTIALTSRALLGRSDKVALGLQNGLPCDKLGKVDVVLDLSDDGDVLLSNDRVPVEEAWFPDPRRPGHFFALTERNDLSDGTTYYPISGVDWQSRVLNPNKPLQDYTLMELESIIAQQFPDTLENA